MLYLILGIYRKKQAELLHPFFHFCPFKVEATCPPGASRGLVTPYGWLWRGEALSSGVAWGASARMEVGWEEALGCSWGESRWGRGRESPWGRESPCVGVQGRRRRPWGDQSCVGLAGSPGTPAARSLKRAERDRQRQNTQSISVNASTNPFSFLPVLLHSLWDLTPRSWAGGHPTDKAGSEIGAWGAPTLCRLRGCLSTSRPSRGPCIHWL